MHLVEIDYNMRLWTNQGLLPLYPSLMSSMGDHISYAFVRSWELKFLSHDQWCLFIQLWKHWWVNLEESGYQCWHSFFLGWDMFLISCELWFIIVLGWLGGWKKLLPISFSCSWKLLCYASSYVTQSIRWWFAVLQKEKTSQESWRWRKSLRWHRYGCLLLSFHGISYSIMSHFGFSCSLKTIDQNCLGTMMSWLSCMPENQAFFFLSMVYTSETWMKKNIRHLATKWNVALVIIWFIFFRSGVHTHISPVKIEKLSVQPPSLLFQLIIVTSPFFFSFSL